MATAQEIVDLALDLVIYSARAVILGELARFPVHQTNWCSVVNDYLLTAGSGRSRWT